MTDLNKSKIAQFDKLMEEYQSLQYYRNSLAGTVLNNVEALYIEKTTSLDSKNVDKKLDPESIRSINKEIENTDVIISFFKSILYGEHTVRDSNQFDVKINENDDDTDRFSKC
jgi:hypothetical protein